jgi:hypothetical protein
MITHRATGPIQRQTLALAELFMEEGILTAVAARGSAAARALLQIGRHECVTAASVSLRRTAEVGGNKQLKE